MASSLHHYHVFCPQISPRTVSEASKHTLVSFPNTKLSSHGKALSRHNNHGLSTCKYAATTTTTIFTRDEEKLDMKVEEAQKLLRSTSDPAQGLVMVDAIQRLGVNYYFRDQIKAILRTHHRDHVTYSASHDSLRFRLLRQHGFPVSPDVFDKYKDGGKHFNDELKHDIEGLSGLFEASQLSCEGEDSLEEVGDFSKQILSDKLVRELDHRQARAVRNSLAYPFHKSLPRFMAEDFLNESQTTDHEWSNILKELHILDSNKVKSLHQNEIMQVSKWWKELGLAKELKFVRDEPEKWYMWPMAMVTDPSMSAIRVELTKPISLIYAIDDIFDVHGTLEELILFTDVIERWDLDALEQLPEYMRICFKALNDTTNEISYRIHRDHGSNPVHSLRLAWGSLCKAFLVEARWFGSGRIPKPDEYLENGIVSSGVHVALVHLYFLLGQNATHQSALVDHASPIIFSSGTILRLWDDLGSAKDENQDGHDGSYLEYYMNEHRGTTREDARAYVFDKISEAWKELNRACISPSPFSEMYKEGCLNLARMVPLMYNYDETHELPILKAHMRSLLL